MPSKASGRSLSLFGSSSISEGTASMKLVPFGKRAPRGCSRFMIDL
jgi:hypothetical protein